MVKPIFSVRQAAKRPLMKILISIATHHRNRDVVVDIKINKFSTKEHNKEK